MFSRKVFSERLILLKNIHNISNGLLADILKLKSRSTINNLENQEASPSVELLTDIADLFGVSTDWLSGQAEEPYNLSNLRKIENILYPYIDTGLVDHPERQFFYYVKIHFFHTLKYAGCDHIQEMECFCPAARANVIFALRVILYASEKYYHDGHNLNYNLPELLHDILNGEKTKKEVQETGIAGVIIKTSNLLHIILNMGKKTERALAELCHFCYFDVLEYYWHPRTGKKLSGSYKNDIIFDINKPPLSLRELDSKIDYFSKKEVCIY